MNAAEFRQELKDIRSLLQRHDLTYGMSNAAVINRINMRLTQEAFLSDDNIAKRKRVPEHRVRIVTGPWTIRFWVEADSDFGGISNHVQASARAIASIPLRVSDMTAQAMCEHIVNHFGPGLATVEVCDDQDNGFTIHVDWP